MTVGMGMYGDSWRCTSWFALSWDPRSPFVGRKRKKQG